MIKNTRLTAVLVASCILFTQVPHADASTGLKYASEQTAVLKTETSKFAALIKTGNIYSINKEYDQLTSQIEKTEASIGKVSGKSVRKKLNEGAVRPAKIQKERVIYELSEYRLMYDAGKAILTDRESLVKPKTAKLSRLAERAVQIKQAGSYEKIPTIINAYLSGMAAKLKNGTFIEKTPGKGKVNSFEYDVFLLTNLERQKAGLSQLTLSVSLANVAKEKSHDMDTEGYFDHDSPKYGSPFAMMQKFDIKYQFAGENIAMGFRTPEDAMNGWMNSEGHRKNILRESFTKIGTGFEQYYWTQMFIG